MRQHGTKRNRIQRFAHRVSDRPCVREEGLLTMKRNKGRFLSVVLLAGILVLASACSGSKKEEAAEKQAGAEPSSGNVTAVEPSSGNMTAVAQASGNETAVEQPAGTVTAGEQTNSTQISGAQPEGETAGAPPVVTENPTDETLTEGYSCMYIAAADNATKMEWRAVSPDGEIDIPYAELSTYFPYMEFIGEDGPAISVYNVSLEFDGWGSYCRFTNSAGSTDCEHAVTHVDPIQDEEPEQTDQQLQQTEQQSEQTEPDPSQTELQPIQAVQEE